MSKLFDIVELEQNTPEWHDWRFEGIGASDASKIMGEGFETSSELLFKKKNRIVDPVNEHMQRGIDLEPKARQQYETLKNIQVSPLCIQSKEYPWMRASLDGISDDYSTVIEIKCGRSAYKKATYREIPSYYEGQIQHQLMITGSESLDYVAYWPGERCIILKAKRDERYIKRLFEAECTFYEKMCS